MENEKIVEEKNVEKKPKNSPISYVIAILILAAVAYAYYCTIPKAVPQEGSQFIGTYEYEPASDGSYPFIDLNGNPRHIILILNEDGTGHFIHKCEADSDEEDQNESIVWREKDGGAAIYYPETGSAISYFFYTNENGNLILDMVMTNGEVTLSYNEEYGTWIKTA